MIATICTHVTPRKERERLAESREVSRQMVAATVTRNRMEKGATIMTIPGDGASGQTDPVRTQVPGRWRITLSGVMPEASWPARLLELAQVIPEAQKLGLAVEGSTLEFDCPDTDEGVLREHLHTRIRLIKLLIREAGGHKSQP